MKINVTSCGSCLDTTRVFYNAVIKIDIKNHGVLAEIQLRCSMILSGLSGYRLSVKPRQKEGEEFEPKKGL